MAVLNFQGIINNMQSMGFFQYLFPFLLALAIIWGLMKSTPKIKEMFPDQAKALISIIFAFFVMLYTSWNSMIVSFFANLGGTFLVLASGIIFIILLTGLIGFHPWELISGDKGNKWAMYGVALLIVFFLILVLMGAGAGWLIPIPGISLGSDFWTVVFVIAILAIAFWAMTQKDGGGAKPEEKKE